MAQPPMWNNDKDLYKSSSRTTGEEKSNYSSKSKSYQVVIGIREHRIIMYGLKCRTFRLCELIAEYHGKATGKERMKLFNKYYCALLRLMKRGFVVKLSRGVYRLVKVPTSIKVIDPRNKSIRCKSVGEEKVCARAGRYDSLFALLEDELGVRIRSSNVRRYRLRFHSVVKTGRPENYLRLLFLRVVFAYEFSRVLRDRLGRYLSRRERRRIVRLVRLLVRDVVFNWEAGVEGVHGVYSDRRFIRAPNDGLTSFRDTIDFPVLCAREVGVDVIFSSGFDFRSLINSSRIYVEELGYAKRPEAPLPIASVGR